MLTREPGKYLDPQFSPDDRLVVYVKSVGGYLTTPWHGLEPGVYRVATDGKSAPVRITKTGEAPQFGADPARVYVTRPDVQNEVDLSTTLVSMNLDGGAHHVTHDPKIAEQTQRIIRLRDGELDLLYEENGGNNK